MCDLLEAFSRQTGIQERTRGERERDREREREREKAKTREWHRERERRENKTQRKRNTNDSSYKYMFNNSANWLRRLYLYKQLCVRSIIQHTSSAYLLLLGAGTERLICGSLWPCRTGTSWHPQRASETLASAPHSEAAKCAMNMATNPLRMLNHYK